MSEDLNEEVHLSEISDIGQQVPKGRYRCKLSAINGKMSKGTTSAPAPMVEAIFDVMEGEHEGMSLTIYYSLKLTKSEIKQGPNKGKIKWTGRGIQDMRAACAAVNAPLPDNTFSSNPTVEQAQAWAKEYGKRMHPSLGEVEIAVIEEVRRKKVGDKWVNETDENGKNVMTTRSKVIGRWKGAQPGAAAGAANGNVLEGIAGL